MGLGRPARSIERRMTTTNAATNTPKLTRTTPQHNTTHTDRRAGGRSTATTSSSSSRVTCWRVGTELRPEAPVLRALRACVPPPWEKGKEKRGPHSAVNQSVATQLSGGGAGAEPWRRR